METRPNYSLAIETDLFILTLKRNMKGKERKGKQRNGHQPLEVIELEKTLLVFSVWSDINDIL